MTTQVPLAPPPPGKDPVQDGWFWLLWKRLTDPAQLLATASLPDLGSAKHTDLTDLNTTSYTHLTAANHTDLTDGGDSTLHYHATDRARANHTGTQTASTISDFQTTVSSNTDVAANTAARHAAATVADTTSVDMSITGQQLSAVVLPAGVDHSQLASLNSANYYHLTNAEYTDLTDNGETTKHYHALDRFMQTGIVTGGVVTLNTDTTKVDITACTYTIQGVPYTYAGATAYSPGLTGAQTARRLGLSSSGLVDQSGNFTDAQKQTILPIARVQTVQGESGAGSHLIAPLDLYFIISETGYLQRLWQEQAIGVLYYTGGIISESATARQVNESAGVFYSAQRNKVTIPGSVNIQAIPSYHSGGSWTVGSKATLVVSNTQYDNGTNLTTLNNNKWASHTLLKSPKNIDEFFFIYSQAQYSSQSLAAEAAVTYGVFVDQATSGLVAVASFIIEKSSATIDQIIDRRPFIGGSVGAVLGTSTLQQTYDNSTTPEIVVDTTRGALTVQDNAVPIGANLFEVKTSGGATTVLGITAAGTTTVSPITSTVATGTAPLVVASTTKVANLNADLLDDQTGSYYLDLANAAGNLAVARLNSGTGASATTFWRGDGAWATPAGGGVATLNNIISTPTTVDPDVSYIVLGYLTITSDFTVRGNVGVL